MSLDLLFILHGIQDTNIYGELGNQKKMIDKKEGVLNHRVFNREVNNRT